MKHALILLADGFEETEALTTHDILNRTHEIVPVLCSIKDSLQVVSSAKLKVEADILLKDVDKNAYDFLVLPGGKLGVQNLSHSADVGSLLEYFVYRKKAVYAICAAPGLLAQRGYLNDATYTCFPGFQTGKGLYTRKEVEDDGTWITARSMAYTIPFAEAIVKKELGQEAVDAIQPGIRGLK